MAKASFSLNQWYESRPLRERLMLLFCAVIVVLFLFYFIVWTPLSQQRRDISRDVTKLKNQQLELTAREQVVAARKSTDPDYDNKQKLHVLEKESSRLQAQLETSIVNLVAPREMPALLKDLLTRQKKLQLLSLENLPPQKLEFGRASDTETVGPLLYRHSLRMEFSGDYLSLLAYLRQLETLPKTLVLEEVDIETEDYPAAIVRLQVYTLSLTEDWIGG